MQKASTVVGEEYAFRESRKQGAQLQRVRILQHVRGKKWKAEWMEPNPGLVDYVDAQHLVALWSEGAALLSDEQSSRRIREDNERNGYDDDAPVAMALYSVFDNTGDKVVFYRGVLSGPPGCV